MTITTVLLAMGFVAFVMAVMAVGLFAKRPCLRGSCGGADVLDANGDSLRCGACPNPSKGRRGAADQTTLPPVTSTTEPVT